MKTLAPQPVAPAQADHLALPKTHRILVPTDLSPMSRLSLAVAEALLEGADQGSLTLLHVLDPVSISGITDFGMLDDCRQSSLLLAQGEMKDLAAHYHGTAPLSTQITFGDAGYNVCDFAKEGNFDLIVLPSHGRSGVQRFLLGSVAEGIIQHAPCSVLVVKAPQGPDGQFIIPDHAPHLRHILVGYDARPGSEAALTTAIHIANLNKGSRLTLLHAVTPTESGASVNWWNNNATEADLLYSAIAQLKEKQKAYLPESADWEAHAQLGHPWDVLVDEAKQQGSDLIVVGPHEHKRWSNAIMGSTAQRVVRLAPCSVLALK